MKPSYPLLLISFLYLKALAYIVLLLIDAFLYLFPSFLPFLYRFSCYDTYLNIGYQHINVVQALGHREITFKFQMLSFLKYT